MNPAPENIAKPREPYETPRLMQHGTVEEITRSPDIVTGSGLDADGSP